VEQLGLKDFWSKEVTKLAKRVWILLEKETHIKGKWDKYNAAGEAFLEAAQEQAKLHEGVADFKNYIYFSKNIKNIHTFWLKNTPDSENLALEILERFFPEPHKSKLLKVIKKS
jgi:hypothetical protein